MQKPDMTDKPTTLTGHNGDINGLAFSASYLASASSDKSVRLWGVDDYVEHGSSPLTGHTYSVHCCQFSPCGGRLATCSTDGRVILWDSKHGAQVAILQHPSCTSIRVCRFSPDGSRLVTGSDDESLVLWDLSTYNLLRVFEGHEASVLALAFSPVQGLYIVSGSCNGDLRVWDGCYGHGKQLCFLLDGHDLGVTGADFSPSYGSAADDASAQPCKQVRYLLATCGNDDVVKLWHLSAISGSSSVDLQPRSTLAGHVGPVMTCCFSPNGQLLASAGSDKSIRLWDPLEAATVHILSGHTRYVTCCAFSADSMQLASGSNDRQVKVWTLTSKPAPQEVATAADLVDLSLACGQRVPVAQWSVQDVCRWLEQLGMAQYTTQFHANAIDGQELVMLTPTALQQHIGIAPLGHRNKIMRALENIDQHPVILPCENDDNIPDEYLCPITREVMLEPVLAADGYTYERAAIQSWLEAGKANSPMTNAALPHQNLVPNRCLKMLIVKWCQTTL